MKKLILFLSVLLLINTVNSQSIIYGIEYDAQSNVNYFVSVNPENGIITQIDSLPEIKNIMIGSSALNRTDKIYTFTNYHDSDALIDIYSLDINTGAIISNPTLSSPIVKELHYSNIDGNYYAIENERTSIVNLDSTGHSLPPILVLKYYLVSINSITGYVTRIDSIQNCFGVSLNNSSFNSNNGQFVFVDFNNIIYTLDVSTGAIISNPTLSAKILELQLDLSTGNYYAIEYDELTGINYLVNVYPTTGLVTRIDSIAGLTELIIGTSTLDTLNGLYSFVNQDNELVSITLNDVSISSSMLLSSTLSNLQINTTAAGRPTAVKGTNNNALLKLAGNSSMIENQIKAFPNPAKDNLTINVNFIPTTLNIYDINGSLINSEILSDESNTINVSEYKTGLYFFTLFNKESTKTIKIMIKE